MRKVLYAVVDKDGDFVRNSRKQGAGYRVYEKRATAERWAVWEGDAVVELVFNTDAPPLFIRSKTIRSA